MQVCMVSVPLLHGVAGVLPVCAYHQNAQPGAYLHVVRPCLLHTAAGAAGLARQAAADVGNKDSARPTCLQP